MTHTKPENERQEDKDTERQAQQLKCHEQEKKVLQQFEKKKKKKTAKAVRRQ